MSDWRDRCGHGRYDAHDNWDDGIRTWPGCDGGRPVTDADIMRTAAQIVHAHPDGSMAAEFALEASRLLQESPKTAATGGNADAPAI